MKHLQKYILLSIGVILISAAVLVDRSGIGGSGFGKAQMILAAWGIAFIAYPFLPLPLVITGSILLLIVLPAWGVTIFPILLAMIILYIIFQLPLIKHKWLRYPSENKLKIAGIALGLTTICIGITHLVITLNYFGKQSIWDDGWITYRYGRNLVNGFGLKWNPADPWPLEAYTSFTHVLLSALFIKSGVDPAIGTKISTLTCLVGILGLFKLHSMRRNFGRAGFIPAALFLVINPLIFFHTTTGMDTLYAAFALTLSTVLFFQCLDSEKYVPLLYISFVLGILTRPDSGLLYIFYLLILLTLYWSNKRFWMWGVLFLIIPAVSYIGFKLFYFGEILPNSFYFKSRILELPQLGNVVDFSGRYIAAAFIVLLGLFLINKISAREFAAFLCLAITTGYFASVRVAMASGLRFIIPLLPSIIVTLIEPMGQLIQNLWDEKNRFLQPLFSLAILVTLTLTFIPAPVNYKSDLDKLTTLNYSGITAEQIGHTLDGFKDPQKITLVTVQAGAIPYFSNMFHIDPYGLVTKDKRTNPFSPDMVFERNPDIIVLHTIVASADNDGNVVLDPDITKSELGKAILRKNDNFTPYSIVSDQRFSDFKLIIKLPYMLTPNPEQYYYVFARTSSPHFSEIKLRFKNFKSKVYANP